MFFPNLQGQFSEDIEYFFIKYSLKSQPSTHFAYLSAILHFFFSLH